MQCRLVKEFALGLVILSYIWVKENEQDYRGNLITTIKELLNDDQFKCRNRCGNKGFVRNRKLSFKILIIFISQGLLKSVQRVCRPEKS